MSSPNIFYEVHLVTPEVDVAGRPSRHAHGGHRPGATRAWSLTVSYLDVQDLYVITPDPADPALPARRRVPALRAAH
ncbi:MAG: penicillin acylase family protein [Alphaproteobacteria bacterium]|nr:penicillin acylase family protein [Alphaproteobacteria bacterium]